jgi:hypothetical protein
MRWPGESAVAVELADRGFVVLTDKAVHVFRFKEPIAIPGRSVMRVLCPVAPDGEVVWANSTFRPRLPGRLLRRTTRQEAPGVWRTDTLEAWTQRSKRNGGSSRYVLGGVES